MGVRDYDLLNSTDDISDLNRYIEGEIPPILKRPIPTTNLVDPNQFTLDGAVMANVDINEFAARENARIEAESIKNREIPVLPNEIPLENVDHSTTVIEENDEFKKSLSIMRSLNVLCQKVDLGKFIKVNNSINNSPLVLVSKSDEYEIYAYNAETMSIDADTRVSYKNKERKLPYGYNETKINPSNYVPMHVVDYEFNLMETKNWSNNDIIVIKPDGTRNVIEFSDSRTFKDGNILDDYPLRTAVFNFRSIFSQMTREYDNQLGYYTYKTQTQQNNSLRAALSVIEAISDKKFVMRREYKIQYDEASRIVSNFADNKYDYKKDSVYFILGLLLREHPSFVLHNDDEHSYPNLITVVFDTVVDLDKFLNNAKTVVIPFANKAVHIGNMATCPTWNQIQYAMDETLRKSLTNVLATNYNCVKVLSNSNPITYYYKVGNDVKSVTSIFTSNKSEEGIYLYNFENEDLKKNVDDPLYISETKIIKLDEARDNGFFLSETDCILDGNTEHHIKSTAAMAGLEAAKTTLMSHQENQNLIKTKFELLEKENQAKQIEYENKISLMQKDHETQQKALEMKIQELEKKSEMQRLSDYYETRSHERKDTTETIKFIPTVLAGIGGVIASAGAIALYSGRSKLSNVIAMSLKGNLAVIGGVYAITEISKKIYKILKENNVFENTGKMISSAFSGIKSLVSRVYSGAKNVASSVYEGVKSVASSVYDGACSVARGVGDFFSSAFSFIW
jgi:hypothetical protein